MEFLCHEPARLDAFLASHLDSVSRARTKKMIEDGAVTVNGKKVRKGSHSVKTGDRICADIDAQDEDATEAQHITPVNLGLRVLYEDDACLVIDKPAGIAVHPGAGIAQDEPTILHGIAFLFEEKKIPFSPEGVLVHRLDRGTTGCLLCAKTVEAHAALQKQFEERTVAKFYLAIVAGVPDPAAAVIDAPIGRNLTDRTKMSVLRTSVSRDARTTYVTLDVCEDAALLECELHTGRTHQIRVHLASIGHPLLGDEAYSTQRSRKISSEYEAEKICLHAWKLTFDSPFTDKEVFVQADPHAEFVKISEATGLRLR